MLQYPGSGQAGLLISRSVSEPVPMIGVQIEALENDPENRPRP